MRLTLILAGLMVAALETGGALAQERQAFSGAWVMDMTRSESAAQAADAAPRTPIRLSMTLAAASLTITTTTDGKAETVPYSFTSTDRTIGAAAAGPDERAIDQALARWDGPTLVTETVYRVNGMSAKKIETRRLSANGLEMTVATEMQMQHGYESNGKGPAGYSAVKDVYLRDGK